MKGYIVADVTVTDAGNMARYREWSTRAMQEHGATILVRGGDCEVLDGPWIPDRLSLLEFANPADALNFYRSHTYTHARTLREGAAIVRMVLLHGFQ